MKYKETKVTKILGFAQAAKTLFLLLVFRIIFNLFVPGSVMIFEILLVWSLAKPVTFSSSKDINSIIYLLALFPDFQLLRSLLGFLPLTWGLALLPKVIVV